MDLNRIKKIAILYLKGLAMGAADVVPGVSGGTVAFVSGIYEELLVSIGKLNPTIFFLLKSKGLKATWDEINGTFLLTLFCGIASSILTLSHLVTRVLEHYPICVWSLFFGLILGSTFLVKKQVSEWTPQGWGLMLLAMIAAYFLTVTGAAQGRDEMWYVFLSGCLAICAMILPGISGAFILVLLGMYSPVIEGLRSFDLGLIATFCLGCLVGLLSFCRFLSWMFSRFHNQTLIALLGFMLGSLNKIWPWKETLESFENSHGNMIPIVQRNISPWRFSELNQEDPFLLSAIMLALFGVFVIVILHKAAGNKSRDVAAAD